MCSKSPSTQGGLAVPPYSWAHSVSVLQHRYSRKIKNKHKTTFSYFSDPALISAWRGKGQNGLTCFLPPRFHTSPKLPHKPLQ